MKLWQIVAITLVVASAFLAIDSETSYRQAEMERCAHVRCI
ncbi:hypothetical protein SAMN05446927_5417 [Caballeronia arationis]|jgi:hypothetical protein|uniref:Uncharacterized protein n=1 Tax=Caballeronia arationis TaxID=1777142 RepID=A0A7Z7N4R9_9BURK|nr:hypothetical protein [Caballeronia arationis]SOE82105.1 hypothetical protein SAMN05446927_5417 [Caballeronia arationis]